MRRPEFSCWTGIPEAWPQSCRPFSRERSGNPKPGVPQPVLKKRRTVRLLGRRRGVGNSGAAWASGSKCEIREVGRLTEN